MSAATPWLAVRAVDVRYGLLLALSQIDFHVDRGEVVGLVGDTGAGKSTLLHVIAGVLRPQAGVVVLDGRPVDLRSPNDAARAGVQIVYQNLALVEALDAATNVTLGREPVRRGPLSRLGVLDKGAMRRQAAHELGALGIDDVPVNRPVEQLSGGQRQTVALARAAHRLNTCGSGLLLLDEPTTALGFEQSERVLKLVRRLARAGVGVVIATHDLPFCVATADRVVVLDRGRTAADLAASGLDTQALVDSIGNVRARAN